MIKLDFLFLYEHKVRELENLCLAKYELDKRGYRTKIVYIEDAKNAISPRPIYHTKVLCMMACYDNHTIRWHVKDYIKFDKIIDMQWENIVYPKDEEREGAFKNYVELGKEVPHVSWGKQNEKRLLEAAHIDPKKVKVIGHMGMDFLQEPLSKYYLSREELFSRYQIPTGSKVILFASPYYGDFLPQDYIEDMCSRFGDNWKEYYKFMCDSQHIVLQWLEKLCREDEKLCVVFRPHPGHPSIMAGEVAGRCSNFKIIGDMSVKQWIVACDKVYTGNSSVVVEAFFAKKMCQLLFPIPTTEGFELKLISDSVKLTDYEAFHQSVYAGQETFPTPRSSIEEIYLVDFSKPSYVRFADMAEEVLKDDYYKLTAEQIKSVYDIYSMPVRLIKVIRRITPLYALYQKLLNNENLQWGFLKGQRKLIERAYKIEKEHAHELTSEEEIEEIIGRIRVALG